MKKKKIRKIVGEKIDDLIVSAEKIGDDFDKEVIHRFRVGVKTLRAFIRLYQSATGEEKPEIPAGFKKLYHISGAIRDLQLEAERIDARKLLMPEYFKMIQRSLKQYKKKWKEHYTDKTVARLHKKITGYKFRQLPDDVLADFINNRAEAIGELGHRANLSDEEIHSARKLVKDMIYNKKLAKSSWREAFGQLTGDKVPLDELATEIGNYNDERLMRDQLNSFTSLKTQPEEKHSIRSLHTTIEKNLKAEKSKIKKLLTKFENWDQKS